MKYDVSSICSTNNTFKVTVDQTGSIEMIREKGQSRATKRQGYRVRCNGDTIGFGSWDKSEKDLLLNTIKTEHYAHLAYKELYYDLLNRLSSIGLILREEDANS